jgi:RNA polymerase sigma-70 factor (ECF subfamily)
MGLDANTVAEALHRERVRITAAAVTVLRDVHASDDVFQQLVLTALEAPDRFHDPDHAVAWAVRVAHYRAIDQARHADLKTISPDALEALEEHWAALPADGPADRVEALRGCVGRLPDHARELIRLRYEVGLSCGALATRLGRSVEAVYQTLSRLHRRLRACVEEQTAREFDDSPRREYVP